KFFPILMLVMDIIIIVGG
ncbi:TPA: SHP2/SHP3 family peptide pheromone, partial [Streptococcus pneumoniae]|nr:SHP2/SHP3 family peptide pheromone [Streptococcus pneumoniae]